jgi:HPt (histidine-containing phosphotransfer) domain-containing protein
MQNAPIHSSLSNNPALASVLSQFVHSIPDRVRSIRICIEQKDAKGLCENIHQLKGVCGSYGFHELTPLATQLDEQLSSGIPMGNLVSELNAFLDCCLRMRAPG